MQETTNVKCDCGSFIVRTDEGNWNYICPDCKQEFFDSSLCRWKMNKTDTTNTKKANLAI